MDQNRGGDLGDQPQPDKTKPEIHDMGHVSRRRVIRWFGGVSMGAAAAALTGKFDILGVSGGGRATAQGVDPEESGFELWGDMMIVPADAPPTPVQVVDAPRVPPGVKRDQNVTEYGSVALMVRDTGLIFYELADEIPVSAAVQWKDDWTPHSLGSVLSLRDNTQQDYRQIYLLAYPNVATPVGVIGPPNEKKDEPGLTWPPLAKLVFRGQRALATEVPNGVVLHWVESNTHYILEARDCARGIDIATLAEQLQRVVVS